MQQLVSDGTIATYAIEQTRFITYLYDLDADEFIWDQVLDDFHEAHNKDQENRRTKQRTNLRACIRRHLSLMNRFDKNCPIVLPKITFNVFTKYMINHRSMDENETVSYHAATSYGTMKSALVYLFNITGQEMDPKLRKELDIFMRSLRKQIAKAKAQSGQSLEEGKRPMSFAVYQLMARKLFESADQDSLFAHTFLVLEWNLMARAHSVADLDIAHIEWRQDCLLFFFGKSKGNQTGEDSERPFHVYSNPEKPEICPVLALATYVTTYPDLLRSSDGRLFPGPSQYNRFMKIFHRTMEEHEVEFAKLGVSKGDLGSHSCRKGAITMVTTGCTVSPPMAAVCIRAGWSMGSVKDRYIHYEKAGDQFVGRTVTGIPSLDCNFAISPVYWDWCGLPRREEILFKKELEEISSGIADREVVSAATFGLVQYLFAALVYHYDYLNSTLDECNKMRASFGFMKAADCGRLKECAVIRYPWEMTSATPKPSGIPPHVLLLNKLEGMERQASTFPEKVLDGMREELKQLRQAMKDELDDRSIGGPAFATKQIMEQTKKMFDDVLQEMREIRNSRDAVVDDGGDGNDGGFDDVFTGDFGGETDNDSGSTPDASRKRKNVPTTVQTSPAKKRKPAAILDWQSLRGTGKKKFVLAPVDYKIPFLTLGTLILTWYCGDKPKNVPPYKMLRGADIPAMKNARHMLSMMRRLMSHVERAATEIANRPELVVKRRPWDEKDCKDLYQGVAHFFRIPGKQTRRFEQISWKSYYNMLEKRKWKLLGEKVEDELELTAVAPTAAPTATRPSDETPVAPTATRPSGEMPAATSATTDSNRRKSAPRRRPTATTRKAAPKKTSNTTTRQSQARRQPAAARTATTTRRSHTRTQPASGSTPLDEFGAAFAQHGHNEEQLRNICALGRKCDVYIDPVKYGSMSGKHKCRGPNCDNKVHHTCCWKNNLGEDDECCCSIECFNRLKRR